MKNKIVNLEMKQDLYDKVYEAAQNDYRTVSNYISHVMIQHLKNQQKFWKSDEIEIMEKLFSEGVADSVIAEKLGRSLDAIKHQKRKLGLSRPRIPWTPEDKDDLVNLFNQGYSIKDIAACFPGRGIANVRTTLIHLGMYVREREHNLKNQRDDRRINTLTSLNSE